MPRKKLIIVGAGGLGRIVHDVLSRDPDVLGEYVLAGFLDTRTDLELPKDLHAEVLGSPLTYLPKANEIFIPAVGDPALRRQLLTPLIAKDASFYSYTHQSSVAARARIGRGVFLTPGAVISTDCVIGDYSYIDTYVVIGHDTHVGAYGMVGAMSFLAGGVRMHESVAIHPRATIAKGIALGAGCTVGIGSVVVKNVAPQVTVFGNPARVIYS